MTEPTTETPPPPPASLPRWVPVMIGVVLVAMGALAIYTGLRYRDQETLTDHVKPRGDQASSPGPPGEPGAGVSFVFPGESGENRPVAGAPVQGDARAQITGNAAGVEAVVRIWARRGMVLNVLPDDAMVYVNDLPIGQVRQFNTMDEVYDFAEPGSYRIRIVAPSGTERVFMITAGDDAEQEVARISAKL